MEFFTPITNAVYGFHGTSLNMYPNKLSPYLEKEAVENYYYSPRKWL